MSNLLKLTDTELKELLIEVGIRLGLPPFYIEKDFWVVWVLSILFNETNSLHTNLIFRGGTSLSKAWKCINRFSEDID